MRAPHAHTSQPQDRVPWSLIGPFRAAPAGRRRHLPRLNNRLARHRAPQTAMKWPVPRNNQENAHESYKTYNTTTQPVNQLQRPKASNRLFLLSAAPLEAQIGHLRAALAKVWRQQIKAGPPPGRWPRCRSTSATNSSEAAPAETVGAAHHLPFAIQPAGKGHDEIIGLLRRVPPGSRRYHRSTAHRRRWDLWRCARPCRGTFSSPN